MSGFFLHAFEHGMREAMEIARRLGTDAAPIRVHKFPDDESLVAVSQADVSACIYCPLDHPNARLVELLLATDALRRNGARRLILVAPYLCYMRQDVAFHEGEAVSQQAISRLLCSLFDRIVTVDPHLHRVKKISSAFPGIEAESLSAAPAIAAFVKARALPRDLLVAGPDDESAQWVEQIGAALDCESIVGAKRRLGDRSVEIEFPPHLLDGRSVLLIDDIVSSGATMIEAIRGLKRAGAGAVRLAVVHALFDSVAGKNMREAGAEEIWSSDSIPHPTNAISLADLLADTLRREMGVTS